MQEILNPRADGTILLQWWCDLYQISNFAASKSKDQFFRCADLCLDFLGILGILDSRCSSGATAMCGQILMGVAGGGDDSPSDTNGDGTSGSKFNDNGFRGRF